MARTRVEGVAKEAAMADEKKKEDFGTRHPAELAAAIERCRVQAGHEPVA